MRIVDAVNGLKEADVIAVTGDVVDGSVRDLAARHPSGGSARGTGRFSLRAITRYYSGSRHGHRRFRRLRLRVLMNERVVVASG